MYKVKYDPSSPNLPWVIQLFSWRYAGKFVKNISWHSTRDDARDVRNALQACGAAVTFESMGGRGAATLDPMIVTRTKRKARA